MAALAGMGAGAALGGASGALVGLGIPEYEAQRYEGRVKDSGFEDVSSSGEASADFSKTDKPMLRASMR
jgi:hypothetical protein